MRVSVRTPNTGSSNSSAVWHCLCNDKLTMKKLHDKSVLIVDDDSGMLRALDKVLTGEGAAVTRAQWAGDAMDILIERQKCFDLVITDLRMPFVTGLTVVYAIHKIMPDLPVIVLTAFGSPDVEAECVRQGAVALLEKPLDSSQLLDVIERVFAMREGGGQNGAGGGGKRQIFAENIEIGKSSPEARRKMPGSQQCDVAAYVGKPVEERRKL